MSRMEMVYRKISNSVFNSTLFLECIAEIIKKLGNQNLQGCCFIMDNVTFHKCAPIKQFITDKDHTVLYLPPYSPAFNLIEDAFSKWKNFVRRANCISVAIDLGFQAITTDDCDGFYTI